MRRVFTESASQALGPAATEQDFLAEDLTPKYSTYDNDHNLDPENGDIVVTPEMEDNYLSAEVLIPHGGVRTRGRVISGKRAADGNPIGRAHANPILDT
jgi:hypothetical protein